MIYIFISRCVKGSNGTGRLYKNKWACQERGGLNLDFRMFVEEVVVADRSS